MTTIRTDALVIGGGLAGLFAVLHLPADWDVVVVDKGTDKRSGSSPLAQGGMAVAVGPSDSPELHAADTIRAGAGACVASAVEVLVSEAMPALETLIELGCEFDRGSDGDLDLHREGGQSVARSVHAADATGRELMRVVVEAAKRRARRVSGTAVHLAADRGRCAGAVVSTDEGTVIIESRVVLLSTGGCGALYRSTTNDPASTGDGIALAWSAGAEVADLEFVQFHPTALAAGNGTRRVLLTEALRGDGAVLVDPSGARLMEGRHPDGDLAPRDVVARAIGEAGGARLDMTSLGERLERRFPNVVAAVKEAGFDPVTTPVPVEPAAHYLLGGVATDLWGRSTVDGLYAAGECAATGVHGANRMAGNSLAEAVVFGRRAALAMGADRTELTEITYTPRSQPGNDRWDDLRAVMSEGAGLRRTDDGLRGAIAELSALRSDAGATFGPACAAGELVCRSALLRTESRGVHFRNDHPAPDPAWERAHVRLSP